MNKKVEPAVERAPKPNIKGATKEKDIGLPEGGEVIEFSDQSTFPGFDDKW